MLRMIGLDIALRGDVVLQAWLYEEADVACQMVLHAES